MPTALRDIAGFLVDMDGVLYRDDTPLPGMQEFVHLVQRRSIPHLFLTNNSSRTPQEYAEKMRALGAPVPADRILTSALVTAAHLARSVKPDERVLMLGGPGLRTALLDAGLQLTDDPAAAAVVVVGLDREVTYEKLARATQAVTRGARFFGTNADRSLPAAGGLEPGAGALLAAIETAAGVRARVFGKPERAMFEQGLMRLGTPPERTAMIGDRYETDIVGARHAGLVTIAVATGVAGADWLRSQDPPPDHVLPALLDVYRALAA